MSHNEHLSKLIPILLLFSEERAEAWIALGHYCHLNKNYKRAVYFAHKACLIDTRNMLSRLIPGSRNRSFFFSGPGTKRSLRKMNFFCEYLSKVYFILFYFSDSILVTVVYMI